MAERLKPNEVHPNWWPTFLIFAILLLGVEVSACQAQNVKQLQPPRPTPPLIYPGAAVRAPELADLPVQEYAKIIDPAGNRIYLDAFNLTTNVKTNSETLREALEYFGAFFREYEKSNPHVSDRGVYDVHAHNPDTPGDFIWYPVDSTHAPLAWMGEPVFGLTYNQPPVTSFVGVLTSDADLKKYSPEDYDFLQFANMMTLIEACNREAKSEWLNPDLQNPDAYTYSPADVICNLLARRIEDHTIDAPFATAEKHGHRPAFNYMTDPALELTKSAYEALPKFAIVEAHN